MNSRRRSLPFLKISNLGMINLSHVTMVEKIKENGKDGIEIYFNSGVKTIRLYDNEQYEFMRIVNKVKIWWSDDDSEDSPTKSDDTQGLI